MKRKIGLCLAMVLVMALFAGVTAQALDGEFIFDFRNVTATDDSYIKGYRVRDAGTDWYLSILDGNVSATNILGLRPRIGREGDDSPLGPYQAYKKKVTDLKRKYSRTVKPGANRPVILRGKKDDSSTTSGRLWAIGTFTP